MPKLHSLTDAELNEVKAQANARLLEINTELARRRLAFRRPDPDQMDLEEHIEEMGYRNDVLKWKKL